MKPHKNKEINIKMLKSVLDENINKVDKYSIAVYNEKMKKWIIKTTL